MGVTITEPESTSRDAVTPRAGDRKSGSATRRGYLSLVILLGLATLVWSAFELILHPPGAMLWVLVMLTVISGWLTVRMPGFPVSVSLSDTFTIAAVLLFGPSAGTLLVGLDGLVISARLKPANRTATRVLFNIAGPALAMWLASRLFLYLVPASTLVTPGAEVTGLLGPLAVFAAAYFVLNTGFVVGAVSIGRDVSLFAAWLEHLLPLWLTFFVGTSGAALLLWTMANGLADLRTIMLFMPLLVLAHLAFRVGIDRVRQRSAQFAELRSYAAALRSTADGVLLTDTEGRVTFMNPMAERLTGWPVRDAKGRSADEVLGLHGPGPGGGAPASAPPADEGALREHVVTRRDGSTRPIEEMHASIRDEDESIGGVVWTFRDITQRLAIDAERRLLLQREEDARALVNAANRSKDEFLAILSHELRTPATAIIGWTYLLKGGKLDEAHTRKALAALERSAAAQALVLDDLLDVSRMVRGTMRLDISRVDLRDVVTGAIEAVEPGVEAKALTLKLELPTPITLDADRGRLRQILWNLLANAVKFTPDGGTITVAASTERDMVHIQVDDTGCGIDSEFLRFAFDRFRQADTSSRRDHGGLGLGLSIVRDLVERHGGRVEASSGGAGQGSSFSIWLPLAIRRRHDDPEPTQGPMSHSLNSSDPVP